MPTEARLFTPDQRVCAAQAGLTAFVGAVAAALAGQLAGADFLDGWLLSTRYTARLSFLVFLFAYTAPAFAGRQGGIAGALARNRCELAVGFAVAHLVHFGCILVYFGFKHEVPSAVGIAIGGTGYVLLFAMMITGWSWRESNGVQWARLHAWAPHYLWFVMMVTYVSRVGERGLTWLPGVALVLAALVVRVSAGWRPPKWQSAAEVR